MDVCTVKISSCNHPPVLRCHIHTQFVHMLARAQLYRNLHKLRPRGATVHIYICHDTYYFFSFLTALFTGRDLPGADVALNGLLLAAGTALKEQQNHLLVSKHVDNNQSKGRIKLIYKHHLTANLYLLELKRRPRCLRLSTTSTTHTTKVEAWCRTNTATKVKTSILCGLSIRRSSCLTKIKARICSRSRSHLRFLKKGVEQL